MKILYINNFFTKYGGAENSIWLISSLMRQKGHEVYYYSTDKKPYFEENYRYARYFPGFSNKRNLKLGDITGIFNTFYNHTAKKNLVSYLKEIKPDIVSVHNVQFHLTFSVLDACREFGVPVALYIHDPRIFCPGGTLSYRGIYCYDEPCLTGSPLKCILRRCKENSLGGSTLASLNVLFVRMLEIFDKIDTVICPSLAVRELAAKAGAPRHKLSVINHFIPEENFNIVPNYEHGSYFLYVGRLDREKGLDTLIKAMKNLPEDIKLHIAGTGYQMGELQRLVNELDLYNIVFRGYLSGEELAREYENCIATVLPCNWFETFGRTILESFLYGKPVIASRIAAIPEIVEHEVNGILFDPTNTKELSLAMINLVNNWQMAVNLGKNGRQKVEILYNSEVYYKKYCKLLKSIQ